MHKNRRLGSGKRAEYSTEYKKLNLQEEFLEKSFLATIKSLKIDAELVTQICGDRIKTSTRMHPNIQEEAKTAIAIFKELKWLKTLLQEAADTLSIQNLGERTFNGGLTERIADVGDCKFRLTKLSSKIEEFKRDKTRLETLKTEEEILSSDLREFEKTILTKKTIKNVPIKNINGQKCPTRSEVNDEFTELVARTGHTQGWTDEDHSLFLKIRKKCDSVPQLVTELRKRRAHLTNEEVVNHEAWYKLYTELRNKRKKEITEWRSKNVIQKNVKIKCSSVKAEDLKNEGVVVNNKVSSSAETIKSNCMADISEKKKKMIDEWRAEKARKLAMDEEQKRRLEKAKFEEEKRRRDNKRSQFIIKLQDYRRDKAQNSTDQSRSVSHIKSIDRNQTSCDSLRLIKSFREQDERFVKKRLRFLKESTQKNNAFKAPSNQVQFSKFKCRENSTLFSPTKVWEERCKPEIISDENVFGKVNYVKDIQKLSGTEWRKDTMLEYIK